MTRISADTAILHAHIWSPNDPPAETVAIYDGRIVAVGSERDIADMLSPATRIIDAADRRVLPGLSDAHLHFVPGGLRMRQLNLAGTTSRQAMAARIVDHAATLANGAWIKGGGWSNDAWPDTTLPTLADLDAVSTGHPLFLFRTDCHVALANSAALALARIDVNGPSDPPGGVIDRDAHGRPTGLLREKAMELVRPCIPPPTEAAREEAVRAAGRHALRHGLTMLHNMLDPPDIAALQRVRAAGDPLPRMVHILHQRPSPAAITLWRELRDTPAEWDQYVACKNYMDGALGSRTAWMLETYASGADPNAPCGLKLDGASGDEALLAELLAADAAGLQLSAHAIGDAANRALLDLYEQVSRRNGPRDRRPRVEHAQHLSDADIPLFATLDVIASMQPVHAVDDGLYAVRALGERRVRTAYRFRDLLDAGATLAFGSDWPIASINTFEGIHAAMTGRTRTGEPWLTHQCLTLVEALSAYTTGAARACFNENEIGRIRPGYRADMVMLENDLFDMEPDALLEVRVATTILGGRPLELA